MKKPRFFRICSLLLLVVVVIVIVMAAGINIYEKNKEARLSEYSSFDKTFSVYALTSSLNEPGEQMMLTFNGTKNLRGEFSGDITITKGETTILYYHDCEIVCSGEGNYAVSVNDGWTPEMDHPQPNYPGGLLYADADWERLAFLPTRHEDMAETEYVLFVSPATDHVEAYNVFVDLS